MQRLPWLPGFAVSLSRFASFSLSHQLHPPHYQTSPFQHSKRQPLTISSTGLYPPRQPQSPLPLTVLASRTSSTPSMFPAMALTKDFVIRKSETSVYRVTRKLGAGITAQVFEAFNQSGQVVALKQFTETYAQNTYHTFERESEAFEYLQSFYPTFPSNILEVLDYGTGYGSNDLDTRFLVFPICAMSLDHYNNSFLFDLDESPAILQQAMRGVEALHSVGIGHGDVHRGNFLWAMDGKKGWVLKLADFGSSCVLRDDKSNETEVARVMRDDVHDLGSLFVSILTQGCGRFIYEWDESKRFWELVAEFQPANYDWDPEYFFDQVGISTCGSRRFVVDVFEGFFKAMLKKKNLYDILPILRALVSHRPDRKVSIGQALKMMDRFMNEHPTLPRTFNVSSRLPSPVNAPQPPQFANGLVQLAQVFRALTTLTFVPRIDAAVVAPTVFEEAISVAVSAY